MKEFCVDLEIAKELKENGFPQKYSTSIAYVSDKAGNYYTCYPDTIEQELKFKEKQIICLPISDEILKELPNEIIGYILEIVRYEDGTIEADYARSLWRNEDTEYLIKSKKLFYKLSDCLAELWLDLKKKEYIK